ncbi:BQ5605_C005g03541 [Microbotryum silenes-dioicae]|uniref:BQ5605_C005g03541 protein n=1 Tax=Microbotryum silenes-dioicae TaxID=796604 RepID=A0A2X0MEA7_9BASI|nr:BQ5605_C005g03541 [Microbotryum silenes-dioicae]
MTRTSRRHTSSICQNNRREADPYSQNFVAAISRYLFNSNWSSLKRVLDLILRLAREDGAESRSQINDRIADLEQADSIIIKEMKPSPQIYRSVMGQIAFACNRRNNAMQHRNGLMILACGANDRLTTFLYDCGLTTDISLGDSPGSCELDEGELKEIGSNKYFHVTVDNVDVTRHVNDQQLDRRTELLHGTFGYAHIQNGDIASAYNLRAYSAHQASLSRVISSISSQLPNPILHLQPGSKFRYIERLLDWFLILASVFAVLDAHHPLSSS